MKKGITTKKGHFEASFSCLRACEFPLVSSAGLVRYVRVVSVTLIVKKFSLFLCFSHLSAIQVGEARQGHENCRIFSMITFLHQNLCNSDLFHPLKA